VNDRPLQFGANVRPPPTPCANSVRESGLELRHEFVTGEDQYWQQVQADPDRPERELQGSSTQIDTIQGRSPPENCTTGNSISTSPRRQD
jgi:hypothetical protein